MEAAPAAAPAAPAPASVPLAAVEDAATTEPAPEPVGVEEVQVVMEDLAEAAPPALRPWISVLVGALAASVALLSLLGVQEWLKRRKERETGVCERCKQKKPAATACAACDGTGRVEEEHEVAAECARCEGEGEAPCEACKGEGEIDGKPCAAC